MHMLRFSFSCHLLLQNINNIFNLIGIAGRERFFLSCEKRNGKNFSISKISEILNSRVHRAKYFTLPVGDMNSPSYNKFTEGIDFFWQATQTLGRALKS